MLQRFKLNGTFLKELHSCLLVVIAYELWYVHIIWWQYECILTNINIWWPRAAHHWRIVVSKLCPIKIHWLSINHSIQQSLRGCISQKSLLPQKIFFIKGNFFYLPLFWSQALSLQSFHLSIQGCLERTKLRVNEKINTRLAICSQVTHQTTHNVVKGIRGEFCTILLSHLKL